MNLFSIPDKLILDKKDKSSKENNSNLNEEDLLNADGDLFDNINSNEINSGYLETNEIIENTAKVDEEYDKKYGKLYKTFDVRFVKSKIWENISSKSRVFIFIINFNFIFVLESFEH